MKYKLLRTTGEIMEMDFLPKEMISPHIPGAEFGEHDEKGNWEKDIPIIIFAPMIELFEEIRKEVGLPIRINSGYRSKAKQQILYNADLKSHGGKPSGKVASPGNSPHETGAAMDLAIPMGWTAEKLTALVRKTALNLGYGFVRIGIKKYGGRFIHVDLTYLLFEPYTKGKRNPHPHEWKPGVCW